MKVKRKKARGECEILDGENPTFGKSQMLKSDTMNSANHSFAFSDYDFICFLMFSFPPPTLLTCDLLTTSE